MEHDDISDAADFIGDFEHHERSLTSESMVLEVKHLFKVLKTKVLP